MARVEIPVKILNRGGSEVSAWVTGDPTNGMYFAGNRGYTYFEVIRNDVTPGSVGVRFGEPTVDGVAVPNRGFNVPAGGTVIAGPWPTNYYSQVDLTVHIDPPAGHTLFRAYAVLDA